MKDPVQDADAEARATARRLLSEARHAALATTADDGTPSVSRIAVLRIGPDLLTLVSGLSEHTRQLAARPACALLIGEPGPKGDPLVHPRLMLRAEAVPDDKAARRDAWLAAQPKAKLYYDLADFRVLRLSARPSLLNGGFGRAHRLSPQDMGLS